MPASFSFRQIACRWPAGHLLMLLSCWALLSACQDDDNPPTPDPTIRVATSITLGSYLTDKDNNTLYYFARDVDGGQSACTGGCATMWPAFYEADIQVDDGLKASDFGSITTASGQQQSTYKGWPLYYYAPVTNGQNVRELPGETRGNGIGAIWYVASPGYSVMVASKTVVDKSTNQSASRIFLIDARGRTLYTFRKDALNPTTVATNCTGACETAWPPFYTSGRVLPSALLSSNFGTFTRATATGGPDYGDGTATTQHLTYKGQPLYYFRADNLTRGRVEGHGLQSQGDTWFVATP